MAQAKTGASLIGRIGSYLQIVSRDPGSTAFVPLAEAYRQTGLLEDALEVARIGTGRLPHFSPGFATMGRILGQMGRIDEAMSAYARALSIDRQSQSALVGLARLHLVRGERDQARKILCEARGFHPDDEKIADMLTALDLPRPWAELKHVEIPAPEEVPAPAAIFDEPPADDAETRDVEGVTIPTATLAEIYVKQGLTDKALKVYREILRLHPDNAVAIERISQLQGAPERSAIADDVADLVAPVVAAEAHMAAPADIPQDADHAPEEPPEVKKQSPLAVLERWLNVIRQGRANV